MFEIDGKQYKIIDMDAETHQNLLARAEKELGEDWGKSPSKNAKFQVMLLAKTLTTADGAPVSESDLRKFKQRHIAKLAGESMVVNYIGDDSITVMEKN